MEQKKFAKGFYANSPRENAPSFVKGSISVKVDDAIAWLKENVNDKGYVNLDILEQKSDPKKYSLALNTFVAKDKSDLPF